jgi:hypothetical protein
MLSTGRPSRNDSVNEEVEVGSENHVSGFIQPDYTCTPMLTKQASESLLHLYDAGFAPEHHFQFLEICITTYVDQK